MLVLTGFLPALAQTSIQSQALTAHPSADYKQLLNAIEAGDYYPSFPALPRWLDGERYTLHEPAARGWYRSCPRRLPGHYLQMAALDAPFAFTETLLGPGLSLSTEIIKPPHFDPTKKAGPR